jgi:hypothetical protein
VTTGAGHDVAGAGEAAVPPLVWERAARGDYRSTDGEWRIVQPYLLTNGLQYRWLIQMRADDVEGGWFTLDDDYPTLQEAKLNAEDERDPLDGPEVGDRLAAGGVPGAL